MKVEEFVKLSNFKELCEEKNISIEYDGEYMILKYSLLADFRDEIVKQCRGIIFNGKKEVVCKPFDKFCNYNEINADEIDWESARVEEKIDGSLIKLYFVENVWKFATNGKIEAKDAILNEKETFQDLIEEAINYKDIPFSKLKTDRTYMFELVSPKNRIVVEYPQTKLFHIGTRKLNGEEVEEDIGIDKPSVFHNIKDLESLIKITESTENDNWEGFVVVDKNYHRVKVKTPHYIILHRTLNNKKLTIIKILESIFNGSEEVLYKLPYTRLELLNVKRKLAEITYEIEKEMQDARAYYEELDFDRKATALVLKKWKYPDAAFKAIDSDIDSIEYIKRLSLKKIAKKISQEGEN